MVTQVGLYSVVGSNAAGCTSLKATSTNTYQVPDVQLTADTTEIVEGDALTLRASGASTYLWEPSSAFVDPTGSEQIVTPLETTSYTVIGTDDKGCEGMDDIMIMVSPDPTGGLLVPAKFFSPNGDTENDFWIIQNIEDFPNCTVIIFNRQGKVLLEETGYSNDRGWDGTLDGQDLRTGVYYFSVQCEGTVTLTGSITLIR